MKQWVVGLGGAMLILACGGDAHPDARTPPAVAGTTASVASTAAPAAGTAGTSLPLGAMKLTGFHRKEVQELTPDGAVLFGGKAAAKLAGNEIKDVDGKPVLTLHGDGTVTYALGDADVRFNEKDELILPGGGNMAVDDDGTLRTTRGDGATVNAHIEGFKPGLRRTALVFAFGVYLIVKSSK